MTQSKDTFSPLEFEFIKHGKHYQVKFNGENITVAEFAEKIGISYALAQKSAKMGENGVERINKFLWRKHMGYSPQASVFVLPDGTYSLRRPTGLSATQLNEISIGLAPRKNVADIKIGSIERRWLRDHERRA